MRRINLETRDFFVFSPRCHLYSLRGPPVTSERGSSTLLVVVVVLPFLFFLATVSLELNSYFGAREELQKIADEEAHFALRQRRSDVGTTSAVRASASKLQPLISIDTVSSVRSAADVSLSFTATYQVSLFKLLTVFLGAPGTTMPIEIRSRVRRATSSAAIVFDRLLPPGADLCGDRDLDRVKRFVADLAMAYGQLGASRTAVAVIPGNTRPVDMVSLAGINDFLGRCTVGDIPQGTAAVTSLSGVEGTRSDPWSLGWSLEEFLADAWAGSPTERWDLILVTREIGASWEDLSSTLGIIDDFAVTSNRRIDFKRVAVAPIAGTARDRADSIAGAAGLNTRLISVPSSDMLGPDIVTAVVSSNNITVISR